MKVLNLYAGIGGNRKLWGGEDIEVTAVEIDPNIAAIYRDYFPKDNLIIGDAHEFLRANFRDFDFIWASPPCPTHSTLQMFRYHSKDLKYPDMTLYQEIILLKYFFEGNWVVENVNPYYPFLIQPDFCIERHCYWSNKKISSEFSIDRKPFMNLKQNRELMAELYGYDINRLKRKYVDVRQVLRNAVIPQVGKYIFDEVNKK